MKMEKTPWKSHPLIEFSGFPVATLLDKMTTVDQFAHTSEFRILPISFICKGLRFGLEMRAFEIDPPF